MKLCQLLKLSHAEFVTRRKTILLSVLAAGIPLIILLTFSFVASGVEDVFLRFSSRPTGGAVYLALTASQGADIARYVTETGGEILHEVTMEEAQTNTPMEIFAKYAGITEAQMQLRPNEALQIDAIQGKFNVMDILLNNVTTYYPPFWDDKETLETTLLENQVALVKFPTVKEAYNYSEELIEHYSKTTYNEVFSNLLDTYRGFRYTEKTGRMLSWVILAISTIILIGTYAYLLDQELHSMVIYRALGASNGDLMVLALGYLLEVGVVMMIYVVVMALVLSGIVSIGSAGYIGRLMQEYYGSAPKLMYLVGWDMNLIWTIVVMLGAAPVSLLLTLDQFSTKRLAMKLKRDETQKNVVK